MALGSTQPLTEMRVPGVFPGGKCDWCVRLTTYHHPVPSRNLGTLTSWNPLGLSRPVTELLYLHLFTNCEELKVVPTEKFPVLHAICKCIIVFGTPHFRTLYGQTNVAHTKYTSLRVTLYYRAIYAQVFQGTFYFYPGRPTKFCKHFSPTPTFSQFLISSCWHHCVRAQILQLPLPHATA